MNRYESAQQKRKNLESMREALRLEYLAVKTSEAWRMYAMACDLANLAHEWETYEWLHETPEGREYGAPFEKYVSLN